MINKFQISLIAMSVMIFVATGPVYAQTSPEELLESGVYKAEVKGDLEDAIKIFEKILAKHSKNRPVAAQALLHLGSIYQKLGNLKAEETYQRLINEFADQQIAVSEARIRLQKMRYDELANGMESNGAGPNYQLALDDDCPQISSDRYRQFDLSPDGEQIAYQGKEGLYVSDNTGTLRHRIVAHNPERFTWQVIWPHVGQPRWSPDGKWIAYLTGKRPFSKPDEYLKDYERTLALVSPDGKQGRLLAPILDPPPTGGFCWLPDGSGLTYITLEGVRTINLDGKLVGSIEGKHDYVTKIWGYSPDGRWLLFHKKTGGRDASNSETDIYVIPADGGEPVWITQSDGRDGHPTWSADGGTIYFISGRSKNFNIWKVSFNSQSGKVGDDFEQVTFYTEGLILFPTAIGSDNRILFALNKKINTVHVADMADPKTYATLARGINPALSPDGKMIYYVGEGPTDQDQGIFAVASDNGTPRRLTKVRPAAGAKDLSPDGRTLAYFRDLEGGRGLYVLPVDRGEPRLLMKNECSICCIAPRWSPDGKKLAYVYKDGLYAIDASGGAPKKLSTMFDWEEWTVRWSPDGKHIAALAYPKADVNNAVYVVPAEGGEARLLSEFNYYKEGLEWTPDGQSLVYHLAKTASRILKTFLDGRPPELFLDKPDAWDYVGVWAPDGKSYFFLNSSPSKSWDLDILDTESGEFSRFATNADLPNWSADGNTIAWTTETAIQQLWIMEDPE